MANEALFKHPGDSIDYTPGAAVEAGTVVVQNGLLGVTLADIAANVKGALRIRGVFDFAKASADVVAVGDLVYWDDTANNLTTTSTSNTLIGPAVVAAGAGVTRGWALMEPKTA